MKTNFSEKELLIANRLINRYMSEFPLDTYYTVEVEESETNATWFVERQLSERDLEIVQQWHTVREQYSCMSEFLDEQQLWNESFDKMLDTEVGRYDIIVDIDLDDVQHYTPIKCWFTYPDEEPSAKILDLRVSEDEYRQILLAHVLHNNALSTVQQYSELHDIMEDVASRLWSSDAPYNYTIHFIGAIEAVQTMLDPYKDRYGLHLSADTEGLLFLRKYEAVNWGMTQENIGTLKIYTQLTCGVLLVTTLRKCVVKSARYFDARLITDALKLEDYASLVDFLRKTYAQDPLASEHLLEWVQINCPTAALTAEQADAILHVE